MNNFREIRQTKDGSTTLYSKQFDETYHSIHGALTESKHVFIQAGLEQLLSQKKLHIFEMGFGTGLNAMLTCKQAIPTKSNIYYTSVEALPLNEQEFSQISYQKRINLPEDEMNKIIASSWNEKHEVNPYFHLHKINQKIETFVPDTQFDLIYYDAFSPTSQPELWTKNIFEKLYQWLLPGGVLVTYCARGQVKRDLRSVGFQVEALPGPPGKREMTRARKQV